MEAIVALSVVAGLALVGAGLAARAYVRSLTRMMREARACRIAEARDGELVKVVGRLRLALPPLVAPVSGRACALSRVVVYDARAASGLDASFPLLQSEQAQDFFVEDETGRARVDVRGASLSIGHVIRWETGRSDPPEARLRALLEREGAAGAALIGARRIEVREGVLAEGQLVAVCGRGRWAYDPDPAAASTYRERPRQLVFRAVRPGDLLIADDPAAFG